MQEIIINCIQAMQNEKRREKKRRDETTDSENRWAENGRRKGETFILDNDAFARQWEQHVQMLRGENEAGRFKDKEDSGGSLGREKVMDMS